MSNRQERRAALAVQAEQMKREAAAKAAAEATATAAPEQAEQAPAPVAEIVVPEYAPDDMSDAAIASRIEEAARQAELDEDTDENADDSDLETVNEGTGTADKATEPEQTAEDLHPWLLGIETPQPVYADVTTQLALAESIRAQFKGKLPDTAIEAMVMAGVGTIQSLSDVEAFYQANPHAFRLYQLSKLIRSALTDIEKEAVLAADAANKVKKEGAVSIVWNTRTGAFVTAYENQAIQATAGEPQRKRRVVSEGATSGTGTGPKKKVRATLYQHAAYQKMGRPNIVPGLMLKYNETRYYFALVPNGMNDVSLVEATWNNGFTVKPGGQSFTSLSSAFSRISRETSVNGWDAVQWPDPGKPEGWTNRKDAEYPARVLDWAQRNHVGMDSVDHE